MALNFHPRWMINKYENVAPRKEIQRCQRNEIANLYLKITMELLRCTVQNNIKTFKAPEQFDSCSVCLYACCPRQYFSTFQNKIQSSLTTHTPASSARRNDHDTFKYFSHITTFRSCNTRRRSSSKIKYVHLRPCQPKMRGIASRKP